MPSIFNEHLSHGDGSSSNLARHLNSYRVNSNVYPMLDLVTVEIPKGDTFPVTVPFFGLNLKPLDFETLAHGSDNETADNKQNATTNDSMGDEQAVEEETAVLQDFPVLHDFHIQHRTTHEGHVERRRQGEDEEEVRELLPEPRLPATSPRSSSAAYVPNSRLEGIRHKGMDLSNFPLLDNDFSQLEKIEEIRFESVPKAPAVSTNLQAALGGAAVDSSMNLPLNHPYKQFNPTVKRVVMTHDDLMSTIKQMMQNQEMDIKLEKKFLEALVNEN